MKKHRSHINLTLSSHLAKHRVILVVLVVLLIVSLVTSILLAICLSPSKDKDQQAYEQSVAVSYDIDIQFSNDMKTAQATEETVFKNATDSTLDNIVFHLYANAFCESSVSKTLAGESKSAKASHLEYLTAMLNDDFGGIEIESVEVDNVSATFDITGETQELLEIDHKVQAGEVVSVFIEYALTVPHCDGRLGNTEMTSNLACIYPSLAHNDNGEWRKDAYSHLGDPFLSDISNFSVAIKLPKDMQIAHSGQVVDTKILDEHIVYSIEAIMVRDFALVASRQFKTLITTCKIGNRNILVKYCFIYDKNAQSTLNTAVLALKAFSRAFGTYAYAYFSIAESTLCAGGMEYGSFVQLAPNENAHAYAETLVHEVSHQWWFNMIGSDQINSAWIDEGLAEFSTGYFYLLNGDKEKFEHYFEDTAQAYNSFAKLPLDISKGANMNRPLSQFLSSGEYVALVYLKSSLMFYDLFNILGKTKFEQALQTYFETCKFSIATENDLKSAFDKTQTGSSILIENWVTGQVC